MQSFPSDGGAARPHAAPTPATWLRGAAACALAGVLLVLAGCAVIGTGLNVPWMLAAHGSAPGAAAIFFWSCLTVLGLGACAFVVLLAADREKGTLAALLPLTFALGGVLTHVPKYLIAEPRPAATAIAGKLHIIGQAFTGAVSMPSGHSVTAAAAAAVLCVVVARTWPARVGIAVVAALVAMSRVFVGAHWPGDVLVGLGVGLLVAALALACAGWGGGARWHAWLAARLSSTGGQRGIALLEVIMAGVLLSQKTGYPAGQAMLWLLAAVAVASAVLRFGRQRRATVATPDASARAL